MGNSASAPPPLYPQPAPETLFEPYELVALRNCFTLLAQGPNSTLTADSFRAFPPILPWLRFLDAVCAADPVGDDHCGAFLAVLARCCKASKSDRLQALARLYANAHSGMLSRGAVQALIAHSLAAARVRDSLLDEDVDAAASAASDATLARRMVGVDEWVEWASEQLPTLVHVLPTFLLEFLCAVGRLAEHGHEGALERARADLTVRAAMRPVGEPVLLGASPSVEGKLLSPGAAWLVALAIGPAAEPREWKCLYTSASHGLSMNRFVTHCADYGGPSVLIAATTSGEVFGAYIDSPLKPGDAFFGGRSCFVFQLAPTFHVYRSSAIGNNFCLFSPRLTGQLRGFEYNGGGGVDRLGFGGAVDNLRMSFEKDLHTLHWNNSGLSRDAHPWAAGSLVAGSRSVAVLELYGCGGRDADLVQEERRKVRLSDMEKSVKIDRASGMGALTEQAKQDQFILESAGAHTFYSDQLEKLSLQE